MQESILKSTTLVVL